METIKRNILLAPGPTPIPPSVREALGAPIFHHRTPKYRKVFRDTSERMKKVYLTQNPVYTFAGSGTLAMEASLVNFHSAGDEYLVVDGGKFGERFTDIGKAFGMKPTVLKVPYGEAVAPEAIREALEKNPNLKSVCLELCETSTAVLQDIKAIGAIVAKTNALLIVDAISSLGADRLETDQWGVDLGISGSQKALMLPPGLAFLSVSAKAKARMESAKLPRFYIDLKLYEKALKDDDTPWTPAIGIVLGLQKALDLIDAEGLENVFQRAHRLGEWTRKELTGRLGLKLFSKAPSSTLSAAIVPEGISSEKVVDVMRDEKGVTLAGGQGEAKGKIVRIAHMGAITQKDLEVGLDVLAETLAELKNKQTVLK